MLCYTILNTEFSKVTVVLPDWTNRWFQSRQKFPCIVVDLHWEGVLPTPNGATLSIFFMSSLLPLYWPLSLQSGLKLSILSIIIIWCVCSTLPCHMPAMSASSQTKAHPWPVDPHYATVWLHTVAPHCGSTLKKPHNWPLHWWALAQALVVFCKVLSVYHI